MSQYNVKINQAFLNDDVVLGSQGTTKEVLFYSIDKFSTMVGNFQEEGQNYFKVIINLNRQIDQYFRSVYR